MKDLYLEGIDEPLELSWTSSGSGTSKKFFFTATVPVDPGVNILTFNACDFQNRLIATHTMTVTSSAAERPLRDYLRVTELMYDPGGGSGVVRQRLGYCSYRLERIAPVLASIT